MKALKSFFRKIIPGINNKLDFNAIKDKNLSNKQLFVADKSKTKAKLKDKKKPLSKFFTDYKILIIYFVSGIFFYNIKFINGYLNLIDSSDYNSILLSILGVIITLAVPFLFYLYTNATNSNPITKYFIKSKFKSTDIYHLLGLLLLFLISRNSIIIVIGLIFIIFHLFKRMKLFFNFLYFTHDTLLQYIQTEAQKTEAQKTEENKSFEPPSLFYELNNYIYDLASRNRTHELIKIIKVIKDCFNSNIKFSNISIREYVFTKLFIHPPKYVTENKIYNDILFEYWYVFFKLIFRKNISITIDIVDLIRNHLYYAITNKIFGDEELKKLDQRITALYKKNPLSKEFAKIYVDYLIQNACKFYDDNNKKMAKKMLTYICWLNEDTKKYHVENIEHLESNSSVKPYNEISQTCNEGLILGIFYRFLEEKDDKEQKDFVNLIDKTLVINSCINLCETGGRWDIYLWKQHTYNREGIGPGIISVMPDIVTKGLLKYLKHANYSPELIQNIDLSTEIKIIYMYNLIASLSELKNNEKSNIFLTQLNNYIYEAEKILKQKSDNK